MNIVAVWREGGEELFHLIFMSPFPSSTQKVKNKLKPGSAICVWSVSTQKASSKPSVKKEAFSV